MQFMVVPHSAHVAPKNAGQLEHVEGPILSLYEPALQEVHELPFAPVYPVLHVQSVVAELAFNE
jgi:hypothetical protein